MGCYHNLRRKINKKFKRKNFDDSLERLDDYNNIKRNRIFLGKKTRADRNNVILGNNSYKLKKENEISFSIYLNKINNEKEKEIQNKNNYNNNNKEFPIGLNIIEHLINQKGHYSYENLTRIHSFTVKKESKNEENFCLTLKNNGDIEWPEEDSYLKLEGKTCPEVSIDNIKLGYLRKGEHKDFYIKFKNINKCQIGKYMVLLSVCIRGEIIEPKIPIYFEITK